MVCACGRSASARQSRSRAATRRSEGFTLSSSSASNAGVIARAQSSSRARWSTESRLHSERQSLASRRGSQIEPVTLHASPAAAPSVSASDAGGAGATSSTNRVSRNTPAGVPGSAGRTR
eukprot:scaffold1747_cov108-Isochrysis_galbana.AAC.9